MTMSTCFRHSTRTFQRGLKPIIRTTSTMTSTTPSKFEWLVIIPDNIRALETRMKVRPAHFEALTPGLESGFWKMGDATLDEVPAEGDALKINGSAMVALASSKEEVLAQLKNDIYAKNEVWDFTKIQIYPFKCAFRHP